MNRPEGVSSALEERKGVAVTHSQVLCVSQAWDSFILGIFVLFLFIFFHKCPLCLTLETDKVVRFKSESDDITDEL